MTTTHDRQQPRAGVYAQAALATLRAAFRQGPYRVNTKPNEDSSADTPSILRAVAEILEIPYALVAAAAHEGVRSPQDAPITPQDLEAMREYWECPPRANAATVGTVTAEPENHAAVKIEGIRDALEALLHQHVVIEPPRDHGLRQLAEDLGVPPLVVGIVIEQWYGGARVTMRDVNEGLAWLERHGVDPRLLEEDLEEPEPPVFETA